MKKLSEVLIQQARDVVKEDYWKFPMASEIEEAFQEHYYENKIKHFRFTVTLGFFFYACYTIVDYFILDAYYEVSFYLRFAVVTPLSLIALYSFDKKRFQAWQDGLLSLGTSILCLSVLYIEYLSIEEGKTYYTTGTLIILVYVNIVVQLGFWWALLTSILISTISITFFAFLSLDLGQLILVIIDHIVIISLSLLANYYIQLQLRKIYARSLLHHNSRNKTLQLQNNLKKMAETDALTGIYNRRILSNIDDKDSKVQTGVLFFDIDYFKLFNDFYGHALGDDTICSVVRIIEGNIRSADLFIRYGGEEFLLIMNGVDAKMIRNIANRIQDDIAKKAIEHEKSPFGSVTISIGAAYSKSEPMSLSQLIELADSALYQAKQSGRNQLAFA